MPQTVLQEILRAGIETLGLNQKELAALIGIDAATVSRWLKGTQVPRPNIVPLLARTLNVDEGDLWKAVGVAQSEETKDLRHQVSQARRDHQELAGLVRGLVVELQSLTAELRGTLDTSRERDGEVP